MGVSKSSSKKTIVCFINRKHAKKAFISRRKVRKNSSPNCNFFINENLTVKNNEIVFLGGKLKHNGHGDKIYTKDEMMHIFGPDIRTGKVLTFMILMIF